MFLIRYFCETLRRGLFFSSTSTQKLTAYADVHRPRCPNTCCSTTGWCTFLGIQLFFRNARSKIGFLNHPLKLNIVPCLLPPLKSYGLLDYNELGIKVLTLIPVNTNNTSVSQMHWIQSSMNGQNIWKSIVTLFGKSFKTIFYHCLMYHPRINLQICSLKLWLEIGIIFSYSA